MTRDQHQRPARWGPWVIGIVIDYDEAESTVLWTSPQFQHRRPAVSLARHTLDLLRGIGYRDGNFEVILENGTPDGGVWRSDVPARRGGVRVDHFLQMAGAE